MSFASPGGGRYGGFGSETLGSGGGGSSAGGYRGGGGGGRDYDGGDGTSHLWLYPLICRH